MNERIKEFATLAKEHADTYDDAGTPIWFYMYNQKFSELIVRECADMIEEYQPRYLTRGQAREMADTIKENFGVEE